jgi:O-succinylhomoserine sulfhydrylase
LCLKGSDDMRKPELAPATTLVHGGTLRSGFGETSEAIYLTQGFVYETAEAAEARFKGEDDGFIYSRYGNPTVDMFEKRMCLLEGAEDARATASGMAVNRQRASVLGQGRRPCRRGACPVRLLSLGGRDADAQIWHRDHAGRWQGPRRLGSAPSGPTRRCSSSKARPIRRWKWSISRQSRLANAHGAPVVVDNVFATPLQQKPLELGAHVVVYSATKHIDGQGRCLGGVILSDKEWIDKNLHDYFRHTGPACRRSMPGRC